MTVYLRVVMAVQCTWTDEETQHFTSKNKKQIVTIFSIVEATAVDVARAILYENCPNCIRIAIAFDRISEILFFFVCGGL